MFCIVLYYIINVRNILIGKVDENLIIRCNILFLLVFDGINIYLLDFFIIQYDRCE